jgi:hypothetical protein
MLHIESNNQVKKQSIIYYFLQVQQQDTDASYDVRECMGVSCAVLLKGEVVRSGIRRRSENTGLPNVLVDRDIGCLDSRLIYGRMTVAIRRGRSLLRRL